MATNIKIILDERRAKKDNTYPLVLRILRNRKSISIPLGYSFLKKDWSEKEEKVRKSCNIVTNITRLNNYLHKQRTYAYDVINSLEDSGEIERLSISDLKKRILNKSKESTFFKFTEKIISDLQSAHKFGNANAYKNILGVFNKYRNNKDFGFNELNYQFLKKFEAYYLGLGNSVNGLSFVLRTTRAVFNKAIKEGYAKKEWYPFDKYKIKQLKTRKRALNKDVITKIEGLSCIENTKLWHAKNYFLFSFYLQGISFIDMAMLKTENLTQGRIEYIRQKTGQLHSIKLISKASDILHCYLKEKRNGDYIFPVIHRIGDAQKEYSDVKNSLKEYNKYLKEISSLINLETKLTSYVSRHSWATIAKKMGVPLEVISEGLGHEEFKTTQVYLDSFDTETIDNANELITG